MALEVNLIRSKLKIIPRVHAPGDTNPNAVTIDGTNWFDMREFKDVLISLLASSGTLGITTAIIQASQAATGTSPITVKTLTIASDPDAVQDSIHFEVHAQEIIDAVNDQSKTGAAGLSDYRFMAITLTLVNLTGVYGVTYNGMPAGYLNKNLTVDSVA